MQIDISKLPVPDTYWYMTTEEYADHGQQMLADLARLSEDGCIAAAWVLELLQTIACDGMVPLYARDL